MNLAQSLGAAAAALFMGLTANGAAPAQTVSQLVMEAQTQLQPHAVRDTAEDLAATLEARYVRPIVAERRASVPQHFAAQLQTERNALLRTTSSGGAAEELQASRALSDDDLECRERSRKSSV
jgi:hypothetical protein